MLQTKTGTNMWLAGNTASVLIGLTGRLSECFENNCASE